MFNFEPGESAPSRDSRLNRCAMLFFTWLALIFLGGTVAAEAYARGVYLNGVEISSARSQELKNVHIHIDEKGDIYITAPHYQVHEEESFTPLSHYLEGVNAPKHQVSRPVHQSFPKIAPDSTAEVHPVLETPASPLRKSAGPGAGMAPIRGKQADSVLPSREVSVPTQEDEGSSSPEANQER